MIKTKGPNYKSWLRRAKRLVELVKEHQFKNFTVEWLDRHRSQFNTLSGVIEWMEHEERITFPLIVAIMNTERAVRRMIRRKEKRNGGTETPRGVEGDQAKGSDS